MVNRYNGFIDDNRPEPIKLRDWTSDEAYSSSAPVFRKKKAPKKDFNPKFSKSTWRKFGVRDQGKSGSCVAQTGAKLAQIDEYNETGSNVPMSAAPIYANRVNRPDEGMSSYDMFGLLKRGVFTTEWRIPSQKMTDAQLEKAYRDGWDGGTDGYLGRFHAIGGYVSIPSMSIDDIAMAMDRFGCGVSLHIFATNKEWNRDKPVIIDEKLVRSEAPIRHAVTGVDFILHEGERAIVVDDSWGKFEGLNGQRILTESFLSKRLAYAGHTLPRANTAQLDELEKNGFAPPSKQLEYGDRNAEVAKLQRMLQVFGFFPASVKPTGNFFSITADALLKFQLANGIFDFAGAKLTDVRYGPKTMALVAKFLGS